MNSSDRDLYTLERIHLSQQPVHQRDLARIIGLSLGMTNAILKRLAQKGLLQVKKINNRNIQYVVSSKGLEEIARRSYRYLKRTIKNVVDYQQAIDRLIQEVSARGFRRLVLVGNSDLDFIVEHLCGKHHLAFERTPALPANGALEGEPAAGGPRAFVLHSENMQPPEKTAMRSASLRSLFSAGIPVRSREGEPEE